VKDRPEEFSGRADRWWDKYATTESAMVPGVDARLPKDHNAKVHPDQPTPPLDLSSRRLVPHTLTQHRNSVPYKKQRNVLVKLFSHSVRRQLMIEPTRSENSDQHSHFRDFIRDP